MIDLTEFISLIEQSNRIIFFSGAGVSTNSGIPDFRSAKGLFVEEQGYQFSPEEIISHSFYKKYPEIFYQFYFDKLVYQNAKPNIAHNFAKWLEDLGKEVVVVTQNIDGLHQQAGSKIVYELHGSVSRNFCQTCGKPYRLEELALDKKGIPRCPDDHGIIKPDVVLYEEPLDETVITQSIAAIAQADLMIIAGTSLTVYPAAGMVNYFQGKKIVVVNKTAVPLYKQNILTIQEEMGAIFSRIMEDYS